jgi:hypothetical protein
LLEGFLAAGHDRHPSTPLHECRSQGFADTFTPAGDEGALFAKLHHCYASMEKMVMIELTANGSKYVAIRQAPI